MREISWNGPARRFWVAVCGLCCGSLLAVNFPSRGVAKGAEEGSEANAAKQIEQVIRRQESAWNRGDIDAFMEGYWKSESLTFSSGGDVTRGWQATSDRYHRRYATREQMGKLTFSKIEVRLVGDQAAYVLGDWQLERASDAPGGNFTLVFGKFGGTWKIMHDHTTLRDAE